MNYTRICSDPAVRANRSDVICSFPGPLRSDGHGPMYFWGFATMILTIEDLLYTTQLQSLEEGKHRVAGISKFAFASWMSKKKDDSGILQDGKYYLHACPCTYWHRYLPIYKLKQHTYIHAVPRQGPPAPKSQAQAMQRYTPTVSELERHERHHRKEVSRPL